jgi:NAD(P)-dependent dehydrogenase (short-subunit alcohol dehydrogenase family)
VKVKVNTGKEEKKMSTYFLTGANRGLGLEFVRQLSSKKDNLILAAVRNSQADLTDLKKVISNDNVHIVECDTGSLESISSLKSSVGDILQKSNRKLNYLFNNAGINATSTDTSLTLDPKSVHHHIDVNVLGPAKIVEVLQSYLSPGAVIMNMTSGLGSLTRAKSITKCCTYSISKAALNMLAVHQAKDFQGKAIVIVMDPGWVKTRMGGEGAFLEPEESIGGMLKVVHGLKEEDTAKFYVYSGDEVPW